MTHADAFVQAILAAPSDDAPRLIFADWLDERDDPRGEFIRAQFALDRLTPGDPDRFDLEEKTEALLAKYEAEWTAPLRGLADDWCFRRGFVESVTLPAATFVARGAALFDACPVRTVRLRLDRAQVADLAACPHLARVENLDVSGGLLRDRAVEELLSSPFLSRLTGLNLARNDLEARALEALAESPALARLKRLDLSQNFALGARAARALAHAPAAALQELSLSDTNIGLGGLRDLLTSPRLTGLTCLGAARIGLYSVAGVPAPTLAACPVLARLTTLDLGKFPAPGGLAELLTAPALGNLTALHLYDSQVCDAGARALAESPHLTRLTALDLGRASIGPAGLQALAASLRLAGLTALHLGHNAVRDTGARALAESPHLTRLTTLDLQKNNIGGPGVRALAGSPNLTRLTTLDLSENFINAASVRALAASPHLGRLTVLRLRDNRLDEEAARALAESPHLTRLTELYLHNNQMGDGGLKALLYSPHLTRLTELHMPNNDVGKGGGEALVALLAAAPRLERLRKLDLTGNVLDGHEQRRLESRFGGKVKL